ncbi:MAG: hypothetical protein GX640_17895, partial [Fibrobacter sp.]|nr:hypothetical protein [Fibrobacter sp.]
ADSKLDAQAAIQAKPPRNSGSELPQLKGWGIQYDYTETHYKKEGFQFNASGIITTDKGQQIQFNTTLEMSRESYERINISLKAGDALIDPLVINFSGTGAAFSGIKFDFDLNADGKTEKISALAPGSAFLAYDRNGNGIIDDGSELFGPSSGNGFSELADLDEDKNGWIDENDSAFSKLKLWEKNSDGSDTLSSLLERNVGALYTGRIDTVYNLNGKDSVAGVIKETGLWLKESGGTGFMQEVDIVV